MITDLSSYSFSKWVWTPVVCFPTCALLLRRRAKWVLNWVGKWTTLFSACSVTGNQSWSAGTSWRLKSDAPHTVFVQSSSVDEGIRLGCDWSMEERSCRHFARTAWPGTLLVVMIVDIDHWWLLCWGDNTNYLLWFCMLLRLPYLFMSVIQYFRKIWSIL